jgi:fructose-1,6-bisphosphatase
VKKLTKSETLDEIRRYLKRERSFLKRLAKQFPATNAPERIRFADSFLADVQKILKQGGVK